MARDVIQSIFFSGKNPSTTSRHFSITLLIVLGTYVASISTDCLGVVLELNVQQFYTSNPLCLDSISQISFHVSCFLFFQGILAAMPLAYILPAMCYIRLEPSRLFSREKLPAIATFLFGTLVSFAGLIVILTREEETGSCSHGKPMFYCTGEATAPVRFPGNKTLHDVVKQSSYIQP